LSSIALSSGLTAATASKCGKILHCSVH